MRASFPAGAFWVAIPALHRSAAVGGTFVSGKVPENTNPNERRGCARWDRYEKADYPTSVFLYVSSAKITETTVINTKEII